MLQATALQYELTEAVALTAMHSSPHHHAKKHKGSTRLSSEAPHSGQNDLGTRRRGSNWDQGLPVPCLSYKWAQPLVFIAAVACFANSYNADFVFDDLEALISNKDVTGETDIADVFLHDFWGNKLASNLSHKSYRPFTILTFRLV